MELKYISHGNVKQSKKGKKMKYFVDPVKKEEIGFCIKTCVCYGGNCSCVGPEVESHITNPNQDVIIDLDEITV